MLRQELEPSRGAEEEVRPGLLLQEQLLAARQERQPDRAFNKRAAVSVKWF